MSYLDKSFNIVIEDAQYFEFDLDYILAASTLSDQVTVTLSHATHHHIKKNKMHAKQFLGLPEFGVKIMVVETDKLPPSHIYHIKDPGLINYDELVDLAEQLNGGNNDAR
ncbi:MAG TPA: hypothetical protein VGV92_08730 [Gammaproteobacteria bacterium]|nr:hypothetical protein [Gammaproteobacteria bacterium]